jgi:dipeptidyl aminopeptidase/acylaminoacyl peptidase
MMGILAYHGNPACRDRVLERFERLRAAGTWVARPLHWNGSAGSVVGSLLQGEELERWENGLGLPKWLALLIDTVMVEAPEQQEGVLRAGGLLRVAAATELGDAGSRCILALLDDAHGLASICADGPMCTLLAHVLALHRQRSAGAAVAASVWRHTRQQALALTDTLPPGGLHALVGGCIEAAAWDPALSRSAVSDTLRCWLRAMLAAAMEDYGWTDADNARIRALLETLHADAKAVAGEDAGSFIDVFKLLEQHQPQEAARLRARLAHERAQHAACWRQAATLLDAALGICPEVPPLIPLTELFANPARAGISLSPDGQWMAWLAEGDGVMNVWAAPRQALDKARQVTFDLRRGIQGFHWSRLPGLLLFSQDRDGDENWCLLCADVVCGEVRALTPAAAGVRAGVFSISRFHPEHVLVTLNRRDPRYPDLYRLGLRSGELVLLEENPGFSGYLADAHYRVRLAARSDPDGGSVLLRRDAAGHWQPWLTLSADDARVSGPTHFSADGRTLYVRDSRGRDTAALVAIDMETGASTVLAADAHADIGGTINDSIDFRPLACTVTHTRSRLQVLDAAVAEDVAFLDAQDLGEWALGSRSEDDALWLVSASSDVRPSAAYLYDRRARSLEMLLQVRPHLAHARLARMQSSVIHARDGLPLVVYLTVPVDADVGELRARRALPLVLLVHGGPWSRDVFGYNGTHQWLANRGYAVLSVNFRGSTGFGKAFVAAADGEWGRRMDEDLEDAVQWAIERGIADPTRLAIFGGSYGGYAVLSALTRFPHRYACGIDVFGPSNLETLLEGIPPYWEATRAMQYRAIGDPQTPAGRALLRARSPLHRAAQIRTPLLVAQGRNDPRVRQAESEQMVAALRANGIAVEYALYPDEGHGFVREANRLSFNALVEAFLARHLGGRCEAVSATAFPGSSLIASHA